MAVRQGAGGDDQSAKKLPLTPGFSGTPRYVRSTYPGGAIKTSQNTTTHPPKNIFSFFLDRVLMLSPAPASGSHSPLPGCYFFFVFLRFLRFCSTSMATTKSLVCFASTYGMPPAVLIFLIAARSSASGAKLHMQNGISCHSIALQAQPFTCQLPLSAPLC